MSLVIERFLLCDGNHSPHCEESYGVDDREQSTETQRSRAKKAGWLFRNGKDFCPACSKEAGDGPDR